MRDESKDPVELRGLRELIVASGAVAYGSAPAIRVPESVTQGYEEWLAAGHHAGMEYMARHSEIRRDPRLLLEGARTIISMAYSYRQPIESNVRTTDGNTEGVSSQRQKGERLKVATYALGEDYHDVLRKRLRPVADYIAMTFQAESRVCIDSAPIHERYWAERCGIGERGANGAIYVEGVGSDVFLAEIITTAEIDIAWRKENPTTESQKRCNDCGACRDICPTGALQEDGTIDSRLCINYLTIEHRGEFTESQKRLIRKAGGKILFGCDRCLQVCRLNRTGDKEILPEFRRREVFDTLTLETILTMEPTEFSSVFKGSPLKRAKLHGLRRNLLL